MPEWLPVLILIFASILIIDGIGSFLLWKKTNNTLFKKASYAWGANFLNFMIHGMSQNYSDINLLGHSFYFISVCYLAAILCDLENIPYNSKKFIYSGVGMLVISQIVYFLTLNYRYAALIIDICIAAPLIYYSFLVFKNVKSDFFSKVLAIVLIINAIHFLDYPFLYDSPKGSIFGFSTAFLLSIVISVLLPLNILQMNAKKYTSELEKTIEERTASLVYQTNQLELTIKDNMTLVSIVSHDISSPIMIIKFSLDKIKKKVVGVLDISEEVNKVEKNLKAVSETLSKVKEIHATKLGKIDPVMQNAEILPLVSDVLLRFQPMADDKNIKLLLDTQLNEKTVLAIDPLLFKNQVLGNLLSNAIKFSKEGGLIDIKLHSMDEEVVLNITDYGTGIPAEKMSSLFDFHKKTTTEGTSSEKGTGLGLPTVKLITEKMNGQVQIFRNSELKENKLKEQVGTTFSLSFKKAS